MKKSYILLVLAVMVATTSCKKSENELPDNHSRGVEIATTTLAFADADLLAPPSETATQYAPAIPAGGANPSDGQKQIGVITPMGSVDTAALSSLTKAPTGAQHPTEIFRAGDQIGVFIHATPEVNQGEANHTVNTPYLCIDGSAWRPVFALGGAYTEPNYYMSAYFPYTEAATDALAIPHTVALDQSAPAGATSGPLEKSNLLIARGAAIADATTTAKATLDFVHAMSLFEVKLHLPQMVEGRELDSLETIIVKGTETRATINLATGAVTVVANNTADIKPRRTSGDGHPGSISVFEAVVVPQNIASNAKLLEISCRMKDGTLESFDYTIPKNNWMSFKSGYRTSLTLVPTAEASFMGELPLLIDGLAHTDMVLPIFVAKDLTWKLSVENIEWMTICSTAGGTYGKTIEGSSTTGAIVNVYVKVDANTTQIVPRSGEMVLRAYRSTGTEVTPAASYIAVQNYYNFSGNANEWKPTAAEQTLGVAPFVANQVWTATSAAEWVKLATSATYGEGDPAVTYSHVGSLLAGQLFLQTDANNTAAERTTNVSFSSDTPGGTAFLYTVKQAAPDVVLSATEVGVGPAAGANVDLVTVTAPIGVKWKVLSATGAIAGLSTVPAIGTEMVGTGVAQQIKVSYSANATANGAVSNVVVAFATYAATQQKTVKLTQSMDGVKINGLIWATGNLVGDGANGAKVGAPTDYGLYFHFGSLVGWTGGASGDGRGTGSPELAINVKPVGYAGSASWPAGYTSSGDVGTTDNATTGLGDPCRYYLKDGWRLPTNIEYALLFSNVANDAAWDDCATGAWSATPAGAWGGPGAKTATQSTAIFFPVSGYRRANDNSLVSVGSWGCYWGSVQYDASNGYRLHFINNFVSPQSYAGRTSGFPVRCVKDAPTEPQTPSASDYITINGLKWAKGNLIALGGQNAKVGAPGDGGLYFQYGSLVGYKGGANGDGRGIVDAAKHPNGVWWNGATAFAAADVALTPTTYAQSKTTWPFFDKVASGGYGYYYYNTLATKYADFQYQANGNDATLGIGDPCATYLGGSWRMPNSYELASITGNATETVWVPWATAGVTGKWVSSGPQSSKGIWFGPNSRTGTPTVATDLFIPASGVRANNNGAFAWVGTNGCAWSSSVVDSPYGFHLDNNESKGVIPSSTGHRAGGFPVRCVEGVTLNITPAGDWIGASATGSTREVVVVVGGASGWTASATGAGLSVTASGKSGDKATITWAANPAATTSRSGSVTFSAGGKTVIVTTSQAPAYIVINGVKWATGNLVADGANGCKVGDVGDGGLYFQYGGLIGYKGGANTSGDGRGIPTIADGKWWGGADVYSANEVVVTPVGYGKSTAAWPNFENTSSGGHGYYYYNTLAAKYADFQNQANGTNVSIGIGDACRQYLGGDWRLPNYFELSAITGSATETAWVPWATAGVTGKWTNNGPASVGNSAVKGAWFGPNSRTGTPTLNADLFIPASGHRDTKGAFYWASVHGYAWSSSVYDHSRGFNLTINESLGVVPRNWGYRAYGFPVRCVQADPLADKILIDGIWWAKSNTGAPCDWNTAMTRCVSPWRLPSSADAQSLIDSGQAQAVIGGGDYWSSTETNTSIAYSFSYRNVRNDTKTYNLNVRCVQ